MAVDRSDCQVVLLNSDQCVASWHNVMITIWHSAPDIPAIRKAGHLCKRLSKQYPQGCLGLSLCGSNMSLPSQNTRKEIAQWMRENEGLLTINSLVIDGTGFWASSVRSVLVGLSAIATRQKRSVFNDLTEAASFLQPHFSEGAGTVQDLTVLVYQLQNEMLRFRDRLTYSEAR